MYCGWLTCRRSAQYIAFCRGRVAERSKASRLKRDIRWKVDREFESHPFRHSTRPGERRLPTLLGIRVIGQISLIRRIPRGEVTELAEGDRLLSDCGVTSPTEGSNPSLSAIPRVARHGKPLLGLLGWLGTARGATLGARGEE